MHGCTVEELVGRPLADVFAPESRAELPTHIQTAHQRADYVYESVHVRKDRTRFPCLAHVTTLKDAHGKAQLRAATFEDITERKQAEEALQASLKEKEILLKEIHHRVKNNLQIISNLLDLQSDHTQDRQALEMFKESRGRVKSMALIHERLYRSQDLTLVQFPEYVRQLAQDQYHTYKVSDDDIVLYVEVAVPPLRHGHPLRVAPERTHLELPQARFQGCLAGLDQGDVQVQDGASAAGKWAMACGHAHQHRRRGDCYG